MFQNFPSFTHFFFRDLVMFCVLSERVRRWESGCERERREGYDCCMCRQAFYWQDQPGSHSETSLQIPKLLAGSTRFTFSDSFVCPEATGKISQIHILRQCCMHQSYWQDQPRLWYETALYASKLLAGSTRFTLRDSIVCIKATGRIIQAYIRRQHCMPQTYWQGQPGLHYEIAFYAPNLLTGSTKFP